MENHGLLALASPPSGARPIRSAAAIAVMIVPWVALLAIDWGRRFAPTPQDLVVWAESDRANPYPPNLEAVLPDGLGDLLRMASLPYFDGLFAGGEDRTRVLHTNSNGFFDALPDQGCEEWEVPRDITLLGASFETAGSSVATGLGEQIASLTGKRVANRAWPGRGPSFAAVQFVRRPPDPRNAGDTVVLGIVQRSLDGAHFAPLLDCLDPDGNPRPLSRDRQLEARARWWLRWSQRFESTLQGTSWVRRSARPLARWIPPTSMDRGLTSPVQLAWLAGPTPRPALFLDAEIASAGRSLEDRDASTVCEALRRFDLFCRDRSLRLLVVLVPDKYSVFLPRLARGPRARSTTVRSVDSTEALARQLEQVGVRTVDLGPAFHARMNANEAGALLYRTDDTHWSDTGIQVAAEIIASSLSE